MQKYTFRILVFKSWIIGTVPVITLTVPAGSSEAVMRRFRKFDSKTAINNGPKPAVFKIPQAGSVVDRYRTSISRSYNWLTGYNGCVALDEWIDGWIG